MATAVTGGGWTCSAIECDNGNRCLLQASGLGNGECIHDDLYDQQNDLLTTVCSV